MAFNNGIIGNMFYFSVWSVHHSRWRRKDQPSRDPHLASCSSSVESFRLARPQIRNHYRWVGFFKFSATSIMFFHIHNHRLYKYNFPHRIMKIMYSLILFI